VGERVIVIGKQPNLTEPLEMVAWGKISKVFETTYNSNRAELIAACEWHCHTTTAEGFVDYCLENDWLREVTLEPRGQAN
jgi:hypothetical protein